jgi:hypothetical protein
MRRWRTKNRMTEQGNRPKLGEAEAVNGREGFGEFEYQERGSTR